MESQGSNRISVSISGAAIRLGGKRKTRELFARNTVLSHPTPNSSTETGVNAGNDISINDFARSEVTTQSGCHAGVMPVSPALNTARQACRGARLRSDNPQCRGQHTPLVSILQPSFSSLFVLKLDFFPGTAFDDRYCCSDNMSS